MQLITLCTAAHPLITPLWICDGWCRYADALINKWIHNNPFSTLASTYLSILYYKLVVSLTSFYTHCTHRRKHLLSLKVEHTLSKQFWMFVSGTSHLQMSPSRSLIPVPCRYKKGEPFLAPKNDIELFTTACLARTIKTWRLEYLINKNVEQISIFPI